MALAPESALAVAAAAIEAAGEGEAAAAIAGVAEAAMEADAAAAAEAAAVEAAGAAAAEGSAATGAEAAEAAADSAADGTTLFRGVASDSPGYENALNGIANPIGGDATMLEHSLGNTASNFTSWTSDYETAVGFGTNGGTTNGVVLTNTFSPGAAIPVAPNVEAIMGENEFLVPGPVSGASVTGVP